MQVCKLTNSRWRYLFRKCYGFFLHWTTGFVSLRSSNFTFIIIINVTTIIVYLKFSSRFKQNLIRCKILLNIFSITLLIDITRSRRKRYIISWSMWACVVTCFSKAYLSCFILNHAKVTCRNHYTNAWKQKHILKVKMALTLSFSITGFEHWNPQ